MKTTLTTVVTLALASFAKAVPAAAPSISSIPGSFAPQRPSVVHPPASTHHNDLRRTASQMMSSNTSHSSDRSNPSTGQRGGSFDTSHLESRVTDTGRHSTEGDEGSIQTDTSHGQRNQKRAVSTSLARGLSKQSGLASKLSPHEALANRTDRNHENQHAWKGRGPSDATMATLTHSTSLLSRSKHHVKNQTGAQSISNITMRKSTLDVGASPHSPAPSAFLKRLLSIVSPGPESAGENTHAIQPGNPEPVLFDSASPPAGVPNIRRQEAGDTTDIQYLNYILLLEQFQYAYYTQALSRLSSDAFRNAGHPDWVRGRFVEIAENERIHKEFLESAIAAAGSDYVQPTNYAFHSSYDNDVQSFIDTSIAIETISASAYTGLLQFLTDKAYVTAEASVLADRARQAAWINSSVRKQNAWGTGFESPLTPNQVITLLSNFLNYEALLKLNRTLLPANLHPYPRLTLSPQLVPGEQAEISFAYSPPTGGDSEILSVAFLFGAETIFTRVLEREERTLEGAEGLKRYFVEIPMDLASKGTVYATVVRGRNLDLSDISLDDDNVIAGPAIAIFAFNAKGNAI